MRQASSIHFGEDEAGFYFAYVDSKTGIFTIVNLNTDQVKLLTIQAVEALCKAKLDQR